MRPAWTARVLAALFAAGSLAPALAAQAGAGPREEGRLLRDAATLEARGDLAGAERVLRALLEDEPASAGGLFSLERVLRAREDLASILPVADRYLAVAPDAAGARYLKLRVLAELDSLRALEAEARAWIDGRPGSPEPYREVARLYAEVFGPEPAVALLREGMEALDGAPALAPELGDLLMRLERPGEAVEAWSLAVGDRGEGGQQVLRRLRQLEGDRAALGRQLVEALTAEPTTVARRRVAVEAALDAGLADVAGELARGVADDLRGDDRREFLEEAGRRAETAGAPALRLWAYTRLRDMGGGESEVRRLDERIAEAALAVGDTAAAVEAHERLARGLPPDAPERRRIVADLIRLEAAGSDPEALLRRLDGFRRDFPGAPETDLLAAQVAAALQTRGMGDEAASVLEGVEGPRSALQRAFLHLEAGDVGLGRRALLEAVGGLVPSVATDVIQLAGLLERLSPGAARAVADAAVAAHRGRGGEAAAALADATPGLGAEDRARVLAYAARLAQEAGDGDGAARLRTRLVEDHASSPEVPDATLALARWHAARDGAAGLEEAARLLEDLILSRPESPLVPAARRELQRVRGRIP